MKTHPEWFAHRPDRSNKYAENPPKKYRDIYNVDSCCGDLVKGKAYSVRRDPHVEPAAIYSCGEGLAESRSLAISSDEDRMAQIAPQILVDRVRAALEGEERRPLIEFLQRQRWFGGKGKPLADVRLSDAIVISTGTEPRLLAVLIVEYRGGAAERYLAPLSIGPRTGQNGESAIADLPDSSPQQWVHDATNESEWWRLLLRAVAEGKVFIGHSGCVKGRAMPGRQSELGSPWSNVTVLAGEQSNTSVIFDRRVMMKLIRKLEVGLNPES